MSGERGVSSVIGVVLILGITVAAVTTLLVIGTYALTESQTETQLSQMETSMAQMSSKVSLVALGDVGTQRFAVGEIRSGSLEVRESTGNITVEKFVNEEPTPIVETQPLGALVYSIDDREVAYQGGGVWKRSGDDGGKMISPPEYHYLKETLTFPIIKVSGERYPSSRGNGIITKEDTLTNHDEFENPVDDATIFVEIESDYHRGWYEFFDSRADGNVTHDSANQIVRVELTAIFETNFQYAVAAQSEYHQDGEAADIDSIQEGIRYPSATSKIEYQMEKDCQEFNDDEINDEDVFTEPGTYCATEPIELSKQITIDKQKGENIEVIFPEGLTFSQGQEFNMEGDGLVRFWVVENVDFDNADLNAGGDASQLFVYVHSDVPGMTERGNAEISGVIYAPNSDIRFGGNVVFEGAVIADTFEAHGNPTVRYDENLDGIGFETEFDEVQYLHITQTTVEIELY